METVTDFIFFAYKITADGDCSLEAKRHLLFGRKVMTNLDSILKSRDIALSTKVHLVKALVFPVVMHGCESWTIKKAECKVLGSVYPMDETSNSSVRGLPLIIPLSKRMSSSVCCKNAPLVLLKLF